MNQPDPDAQFGSDGCTCVPFTRQTNPPRYLNRPTDTVDMISGWERGRDCPHHAPAAQSPADGAAEELAAARATNQRLNLRAQQLESELATYRRAVADWEITDTGTYVPLRTLAAIAKAAGLDVPARWELHYERVERAEADRAVVRAETLREAADALEGLDPVEAALAGQHAWVDAAKLLRRLAGEQHAPECGPACSEQHTYKAGCALAGEQPTPDEARTTWTPGPVAVAQAGEATRTTAAAYLATPCDTCEHTLNWHRNDVGCTVAGCVCSRFTEEPTA